MSDPLMKRWPSFSPQLLSLLRLTAAFTYLMHGTAKFFAWPMSMTPDGSSVPLFSQMGAGGLIETIGGTLLFLGLFTRPVAFLVAGELAVVYFQFHFPNGGILPILNHGEAPYLLCFIFFYISAMGPGPWSLDAKLRNR